MHPVETYLTGIRDTVLGKGVQETSGYVPLANLINEVGGGLKPEVKTVIHPKGSTTEGIPDGAFFTKEEFKDETDSSLLMRLRFDESKRPRRGFLEVKSVGEDLDRTIQTPQVRKYLEAVPYLVLTNYWDFRLLTLEDGRIIEGERHTLAASADDFREANRKSKTLAKNQGPRLLDFLARALIHEAPLDAPKDLAWYLASFAREALARIDLHADAAHLEQLRKSMEEALGIAFREEEGEHFFRSSLVQTLFYGLFAAWVLWCQEPGRRADDRFEWDRAVRSLHVPAIQAIFHQVTDPKKLRALDLAPVLDWTGQVLHRMDRVKFFAKFQQDHAVQYFYEPFLQAFDPELRKQLGVWYTPPEIVEYMVARVDQVLVSELGISEGLASDQVYVLDPCCGTGSFLVAVLDRLGKRLTEAGKGALVGDLVKQAAQDRIFGFELMPAPFVVAHLQLGLVLQKLGAPLADDERVGVYLTNALTGWEPPKGPKQKLMFEELEEERDQAEKVKQATPILVVLGNPPYSGFAGIAIHEERSLTEAYRTTERAPRPQGQGLNDLYVRFFRMAERKIAEGSGRGIVCYISNYSWLEGLSHTGMRERFLEAFDKIYIDNLHGDRIISEYAPDGKTSETVFAMQGMNAPGIKIGTAISMLVRNRPHADGDAELLYHDQDESRAGVRRQALLDRALQPTPPDDYTSITPSLPLGLIYKPRQVEADYLSWPLLTELFPVSFPGVNTAIDSYIVDIDRRALERRIAEFFDPKVSDTELANNYPLALGRLLETDAAHSRRNLVARGIRPALFVRYSYRPFDPRWLYWEQEENLLDRARQDYFASDGWKHRQIAVAQRTRKSGFYGPIMLTGAAAYHLNESGTILIPLSVKQDDDLLTRAPDSLNLSPRVRTYLGALESEAKDLFHSYLATIGSPLFVDGNFAALKQDYPRIPLPATAALLETSATLGQQVAALLDIEAPVAGVTSGATGPYVVLGQYTRVGADGASAVHKSHPSDFALTVGWGHGGKGGITMPGKGRAIARAYTDEERAAMGEDAIALLGETTYDIWLNETAYWKNVPSKVWAYTIGGYQVLKKWLSYREEKLLGRPLKVEEVGYVQEVVRRLAGLCLLEPALDANYLAVKSNTYAWPRE